MSIIESVLKQIDAPEHIDRFFRVKALGNVNVNRPFEENVNNHPICFMLGLFVAAVVSSQSEKLKNIRTVDVFRQFLNQLLF